MSMPSLIYRNRSRYKADVLKHYNNAHRRTGNRDTTCCMIMHLLRSLPWWKNTLTHMESRLYHILHTVQILPPVTFGWAQSLKNASCVNDLTATGPLGCNVSGRLLYTLTYSYKLTRASTLRPKRWFQFPHCEHSICSYIPAASGYEVYISQSIRYARTCGSSNEFIYREVLLTRKLLNQEFLVVMLKSLYFERFTVATILTVTTYPCNRRTRICSVCRSHNTVLFYSETHKNQWRTLVHQKGR
jgi:hypothetical protein